MPVGPAVLIALVTGALAARKGHDFFLWCQACGVLGLVILAFLPFANNPERPPDEPAQLRRNGNATAVVLAVLAAVVVVTRIAAS